MCMPCLQYRVSLTLPAAEEVLLDAERTQFIAPTPDVIVVWARCSYFAAGEVRRLEAEEAEAVAQEDFEAAANLSSELDALRWRLHCDRPIVVLKGRRAGWCHRSLRGRGCMLLTSKMGRPLARLLASCWVGSAPVALARDRGGPPLIRELDFDR